MRLVAINGKAGSGKSTAAEVFSSEFGFKCVAFADEIKRIAMRCFGFSPVDLWGPSKLRNNPPPGREGPTARKVAQFLGTEIGRELDPAVWVRLLGETCSQLAVGLPASANLSLDYHQIRGLFVREGYWPPPVGVVVPDMRFANELAAIREWGGIAIRLKRGSNLKGDSAEHQSETEQDSILDSEFDYIIPNDLSLEAFKFEIYKIAQEIIHGKAA